MSFRNNFVAYLLLFDRCLNKKRPLVKAGFAIGLPSIPHIMICKRPVKGFLGHRRLDYNVELFDL